MTIHTHTRIMVINAGSSSLRLALLLYQGKTLRLMSARRFDSDAEHTDALLRRFIAEHEIDKEVLIAHRIVHGGAGFKSAVRIDNHIKQTITDLIPLAPLHNPAVLALITVL